MPRIRCKYVDCVFLDQVFCSAAVAEIDPDAGCLTYTPEGEGNSDEAWRDNEQLEEDWAEAGFASMSPEDLRLDSEESESLDDIDFDD
jgi:hypothetical protein